MPTIYAAPGEGPALARTLLAMAADPHEVGVTYEGGLGFIVSEEIEQLWLDSLAPVPDKPEPHGTPAPEKRKPGRPPKTITDVELPKE